MFDPELRGAKQRALTPVAARLSAVSPGVLTALALAAGLMAVYSAAVGALGPALGLWLLNRLLDGLDGEVARYWQAQSDLGGYLDLLADLLVYAALPIGLALSLEEFGGWASLAWMLAAFYVNASSWMLLSAILEKRGQAAGSAGKTSVAMPRGLIEGSETLLLFTLFILLPGQLSLLFMLTAVMVAVTALQRALWAVKVLR